MLNKIGLSIVILGFTFSPLLQAYTNSIGMEFVNLSSGCFIMGDDKGSDDNESPQHEVCINEDFQLGKYEVTQEQWVKVMGDNPSKFKGNTNPVEQISWEDVQNFVKELNKMENTNKYRLPSEAEWEYAARAGSNKNYPVGNYSVAENLTVSERHKIWSDKMKEHAWFDQNSESRTHSVGGKLANAWGLHDMHGNVWEWVEDCYHDNYHGASADGRARTSECYENNYGIHYVLRGASWRDYGLFCRSTIRLQNFSTLRRSYIGFRLLRQL